MINDFQTILTGQQTRRVKYQSVPDNRWWRPKKFSTDSCLAVGVCLTVLFVYWQKCRHRTVRSCLFIGSHRRTNKRTIHSERTNEMHLSGTRESDPSSANTKDRHARPSIGLFSVSIVVCCLFVCLLVCTVDPHHHWLDNADWRRSRSFHLVTVSKCRTWKRMTRQRAHSRTTRSCSCMFIDSEWCAQSIMCNVHLPSIDLNIFNFDCDREPIIDHVDQRKDYTQRKKRRKQIQ
jgi:hypothetical protein